jgi:cbb3-type cytochrome c oxidase subunit III
MNKNKHLLLWSSLGTLVLLAGAAVQENIFREWRQTQKAMASESGPLDVHLRQVVVPKMQVADRCVSCHVGMAAGEQGFSGSPLAAAHKAVGHDPAEFGCTVCHAGQGRATDKADAHGDVPFWPEPMIPTRYAYAGCGTCHTYIGIPTESQLVVGQSLIDRYDCLACHRLDGRGGTLRSGEAGGMEGPDLSRVGLTGYDHQWYEKHLKKREESSAGPWKISFGKIETPERAALDAYLSTRTGAAKLVEAKALFHTLGCQGCHKINGVGGDEGPDLSRVGQKDPGQLNFAHVAGEESLANWLSAHTREPAKIVPGSKMQVFGLTDEQIDLLTYYMLSLRRGNVSESLWPKDRLRVERFKEREFATDGATLYATFCAGCHGPKGEGRRFPESYPFPAIANPDFLAVATDQFITDTIQTGRPGRRMPAWGANEGGLRAEEIAQIVGHLRKISGVAEPTRPAKKRRWVKADAKTGERLYATNCAGCHGARGEGIEAPALSNKSFLAAADDTYLVETIGRGRHDTAMQSFRAASTVHPALSRAEIESLVAYLRSWEEKKP